MRDEDEAEQAPDASATTERVTALPVMGNLETRIARDRHGAPLQLPVPRTIVNGVAERQVSWLLHDATRDARTVGDSVTDQTVRSALAAPLIGEGRRTLGVLYVDNLRDVNAFTEADLDFLVAYAGIAAAAMEREQSVERLREATRVRENFQRYFTPQLADRIALHRGDVVLGGDRRRVIVLFSDIRGFTEVAESLPPDQMAAQLNEYFAAMVECVFRHDGALDKFIGDALMAYWGAPVSADDDADRAIRAALDMQSELERLNAALGGRRPVGAPRGHRHQRRRGVRGQHRLAAATRVHADRRHREPGEPAVRSRPRRRDRGERRGARAHEGRHSAARASRARARAASWSGGGRVQRGAADGAPADRDRDVQRTAHRATRAGERRHDAAGRDPAAATRVVTAADRDPALPAHGTRTRRPSADALAPAAAVRQVAMRSASVARYDASGAATRTAAATLVAVPALFEALRARLAQFGTLYAWAEQQPQPRALQGRGVVYVAELPECDTTVAVRHAWHGGLFAPLTGDRFLVPTRAPREAAASMMLRAHGVPTPELLGYALHPAGPGLRRVDVLTRYVPDAWDFGAVLAGLAPAPDRAQASRAVVTLLAQLAEARAVHPDLNVKNILLVRDGPGRWVAWVLDVDVVRFRDLPPAGVLAVNVRRLERSIRKWHTRHELALDASWLAEFTRAALGAAP